MLVYWVVAQQLQLFGHPSILLDGVTQSLPATQVLMLAAHLAYYGEWLEREQLAYLFWSDATEARAKRNLNQLLYACRDEAWLDGLESNSTALRWQIQTDVDDFRQAIANADWATASHFKVIDLLSAPFRTLPSEYEDWLLMERTTLQKAWHEASINYAKALEADASFQESLSVAQTVYRQDKLAEDAVQIIMRCQYALGERKEAMESFKSFEAYLEQELAIAPLEQTQDLIESIREGDLVVRPKAIVEDAFGSLTQAQKNELRNLPNERSAFIGRTTILAEIAQFLEEGCRLITLVGSGGMGKTRLAIKTVLEHGQQFENGAVFIPLDTVNSSLEMAQQILTVLGIEQSDSDPSQQVIDYLTPQKLLVVLDNLEQIPDADELVNFILENAPNIRIVATSRQILGLQAEQLIEVTGMAVPKASETLGQLNKAQFAANSESLESVQLFLRAARRVDSKFSIDTANQIAVYQICQQLDGSPLALELAANWLKLLSVEEIADELQGSLDLLSSSHKDIPERQRSLRALFESSWNLLSSEETQILTKLSVFSGGFQRQSAQDIADANVRSLLSLVNQSWLNQSQQGRYQRHRLVQQFTLEKLSADSSLYNETKQRHLDYFLKLAEQSEQELRGEAQTKWLQQLNDDYANLQVALEFAQYAQEHQPSHFMRLTSALWQFWWQSGRIPEGRQWLDKSIKSLDDIKNGTIPESLLAKTYYAAGYLAWFQGDYSYTDEHCQKSLDYYQNLKDDYGIAIAKDVLGISAYDQKKFELAREYYEQSLESLTKLGKTYRATVVRSNLANLLGVLKEYDAAIEMHEENLRATETLGDDFGHAIAANVLGLLFVEQNKFPEAKAMLLTCLKIHKEQKNLWGLTFNLEYIAHLYLCTEQFEAAAKLLGTAEALRESLNSPVPPNELERYEADVAFLKENLDEGSLQDAWSRGREGGLELALNTLVEQLSQIQE